MHVRATLLRATLAVVAGLLQPPAAECAHSTRSTRIGSKATVAGARSLSAVFEKAAAQNSDGGTEPPESNASRPPLAEPGNRSSLDEVQLRTLCSLGMPWACNHKRSSMLNATMRQDIYLQREQRGAGNASGECADVQRRIFMQVYGTPQTAMSEYMGCLCKGGEHCRVFRDDGPKFHPADGAEGECKPQACTTTSEFERLAWRGRCGPGFRSAPVFTMLREPVLRAFAFYTYMQSWYAPYRARSLQQVIEAVGRENLNEGLPHDEACHKCEAQLTNPLVLHYFCGLQRAECSRLQKGSATPLEMAVALDAAKRRLREDVSAVFLERNNKYFMPSFNALPALSPSETMEEGCRFMPSRLEPVLQTYSLSERTVQLITQKNAADIALYSYAMHGLDNVIHEQ